MSDRKTFLVDDDVEAMHTPERKLWMAVAERALKDYCFFFDQLQLSNQKQMLNLYIKPKPECARFTNHAIFEFERLSWFIFCPTAEEFNLTFLCEQFFDDNDGVARKIRAVARQQFKKNMKEAEALGLFPNIRAYISSYTAADTWIAADSYVMLRQKRYRN